jgi:tRNA (cmo5U34)-methyltransferase
MTRSRMKVTEFGKSHWADPEFGKGYRDNADIFIVERQRMLSILQSFYAHFVRSGSPKKVLDLGCGDGIVTSALLSVDDSIKATLVDGSRDMLAKARQRLKGISRALFIRASFQEMTGKDLLHRPFDFVVSSLAIHHLTMEEKSALFETIYRQLNRGGYFVNIDVVLAPTRRLEQWYLSLWKEWVDERTFDLGMDAGRFKGIIREYKNEEENKPDRLSDQLDALRTIGFTDVCCYYQYGIFTMFGGRKPLRRQR